MSLLQRVVALFLLVPAIFLFGNCGSSNSHSAIGGSSGSSGNGTTSGSTPVAGQSASAKFLYSSDFIGNRVLGYNVNATSGTISATTQGSAPAHTGPTRVVSDSTGSHLYVINQTSKDLSAYSISRSDGSLTSVPGSPFVISQTPTAVAVSPSGAYVYVTSVNSISTPTSLVYAFAVQNNGSLAAVPGSPFATVNSAQALAIDPQGKYLYVSSYPASSTPAISKVDAFSISSDGALTPVPGSPYTEPNSPNCANGAWDIAIHPSGNVLLLPNMCEGVVIYRIDRTTGSLTLVNGSPFPVPGPAFAAEGNVESIAMDPQGVYFWVTEQYCHGGCSVATGIWKLDTSTGVPTYLSSGSAGCGLIARSDPSGSFVYEIGDTNSNQSCAPGNVPGIWGFNANRGNGSLSNISGSPWKSSNSDESFSDWLAVTP